MSDIDNIVPVLLTKQWYFCTFKNMVCLSILTEFEHFNNYTHKTNVDRAVGQLLTRSDWHSHPPNKRSNVRLFVRRAQTRETEVFVSFHNTQSIFPYVVHLLTDHGNMINIPHFVYTYIVKIIVTYSILIWSV